MKKIFTFIRNGFNDRGFNYQMKLFTSKHCEPKVAYAVYLTYHLFWVNVKALISVEETEDAAKETVQQLQSIL